MPTFSPETNARMQGPPGIDPTEDLFKQRFADMAYTTLNSKFAELAPYVVTFKILSVSADSGSGVGVLIIDYNNKTVYIPVVMVDSALKPMEIFYYKDLNVFLPLTLQWLDEISRDTLDELGEATKLPNEVPQDVDLRDLVIPPASASGRLGYANAQDGDAVSATRMFKEAEFQRLDEHSAFLGILKTAPRVVLDGIKLAFVQQPALLQKLAQNYGINPLVQAIQEGYQLAEKKEAEAPTCTTNKRSIHVCGPHTSAKTLKSIFGKEASAAFQDLSRQGYAIKDARAGVSRTAVKIEKQIILNSPGPQAGWFRLFFADGAPDIYFVVPFPKELEGSFAYTPKPHDTGTGNDHKSPTEYLVIQKDCKEVWLCDDVVGESLPDDVVTEISSSRLAKMLAGTASGDKPTAGSFGVFICRHGQGVQATKPFRVGNVVSEDGIVRLYAEDGVDRYVIDGDPSRKKIQVTLSGQVVFLPNHAKFIKILQISPKNETAYQILHDYARRRKQSVVRDPSALLHNVGRILSQVGADKVQAKTASMGQWYIGPGPHYAALNEGEAIAKLAGIYDVSVPDSREILCTVRKSPTTAVYALGAKEAQRTKEAFFKLAQPSIPVDPTSMASATPQEPSGVSVGMPGAPEMVAMGESNSPLSGVSPTELAIGEAVQQLQTQTQMQTQETQAQMAQFEQQIAMQQQNNQQLVDVLQGIQQRSREIGMGAGGAIPQEAMASPAVAASALAPQAVPEQEVVTPVMAQEAVNPEMVAQQINPGMVDQVTDLQERGIFDTAAIGMLAESPLLQDIVSSYVPNLEKGVDNLGRILLTLWVKEEQTKQAIGDEAFIALEDKLRSVFKNLGAIVLDLSHNATSTPPDKLQTQGSV